MTTTDRAGAQARQLNLPGQAHVAEGPHDQTGMYFMHHAFRRDLSNFVRAVRGTPVDDCATWCALAKRWERFATVLHHHHAIEDDAMWPALLDHARMDGDGQAEEMLGAMEAEHERIDPALKACRVGFDAMRSHPSADHRAALDVAMATVQELLSGHLAHEETEALPYLQRTLSTAEYALVENAAAKAYPASMIPFLLPWSFHGLPDGLGEAFIAEQGQVLAILHRLTRRRFARSERRAFRYA